MTLRKRRRASTSPLERANRESDDDFVAHYLEPGCPTASRWVPTWTHPLTSLQYTISLVQARSLSKADFEACFSLIEETSRADYEASTSGWRPSSKRTEMMSAGLRYVLVRDHSGTVRAFTSLMPLYEDNQPVIYCYEIHLKPDLQRTGLGSLLLGFQHIVAFNLPPVCKVMLTCFKSNEGASKFYKKQGFVVDEISPVPRTLRGGRAMVPDYSILSKTIRGATSDIDVQDEGTT